jgi:hypothetical protein
MPHGPALLSPASADRRQLLQIPIDTQDFHLEKPRIAALAMMLVGDVGRQAGCAFQATGILRWWDLNGVGTHELLKRSIET